MLKATKNTIYQMGTCRIRTPITLLYGMILVRISHLHLGLYEINVKRRDNTKLYALTYFFYFFLFFVIFMIWLISVNSTIELTSNNYSDLDCLDQNFNTNVSFCKDFITNNFSIYIISWALNTWYSLYNMILYIIIFK